MSLLPPKLTPAQTEEVFRLLSGQKNAKKTSYISFAFGTAILNQDSTAGVTWSKSGDSPDLIIPPNAWLHRVMISAFVQLSNVTGPNGDYVQSLQGFPVTFTMSNLLKVIRGEGQGNPAVPNPNLQPIINFLNGSMMVLPVGVDIKFEKFEHPISESLGSINLLVPQPWFFLGAQNTETGTIGLAAQVTLGFESGS